jgi:hypothetical protein
MKTRIFCTTLIISWIHIGLAQTGQFTVSGLSDPWLAGMPNGSTASAGDSAPYESPVLVTGIPVASGFAYSFSASGFIAYDVGLPFYGPDGWAANFVPHTTGAENGIADLTSPLDAVIGVFLGPNQPDLSPAPGALNFSTASSQDYLTLSPSLQQPFFIGDGLTSGQVVQQVIAPAGATRLFIGTFDASGWYNDPGAFTVYVTRVPEPSITAVLLIGIGVWSLVGKISRKQTCRS